MYSRMKHSGNEARRARGFVSRPSYIYADDIYKFSTASEQQYSRIFYIYYIHRNILYTTFSYIYI